METPRQRRFRWVSATPSSRAVSAKATSFCSLLWAQVSPLAGFSSAGPTDPAPSGSAALGSGHNFRRVFLREWIPRGEIRIQQERRAAEQAKLLFIRRSRRTAAYREHVAPSVSPHAAQARTNRPHHSPPTLLK